MSVYNWRERENDIGDARTKEKRRRGMK